MEALNRVRINAAFKLLGELLEKRTSVHMSLVICGGSALIALGLASRATKDVDIVARLNFTRRLTRFFESIRLLLRAMEREDVFSEI